LLRSWRIRFRAVGGEVAFSGTKDENLIPALHRLSNPTFFSLDQDFYHRSLAHSGYCLVWLDVRGRRAAEFIRRFLREPAFDMQAKRMGIVARVHADGILWWRTKQRAPQAILWSVR